MNEKPKNTEFKPDVELTQRVLMSLVVDISQLRETVEQVSVQVYTLAREHGVDPEVK